MISETKIAKNQNKESIKSLKSLFFLLVIFANVFGIFVAQTPTAQASENEWRPAQLTITGVGKIGGTDINALPQQQTAFTLFFNLLFNGKRDFLVPELNTVGTSGPTMDHYYVCMGPTAASVTPCSNANGPSIVARGGPQPYEVGITETAVIPLRSLETTDKFVAVEIELGSRLINEGTRDVRYRYLAQSPAYAVNVVFPPTDPDAPDPNGPPPNPNPNPNPNPPPPPPPNTDPNQTDNNRSTRIQVVNVVQDDNATIRVYLHLQVGNSYLATYLKQDPSVCSSITWASTDPSLNLTEINNSKKSDISFLVKPPPGVFQTLVNTGKAIAKSIFTANISALIDIGNAIVSPNPLSTFPTISATALCKLPGDSVFRTYIFGATDTENENSIASQKSPSAGDLLVGFLANIVEILVHILTSILYWILSTVLNPLIIILLSLSPHDASFSAVILPGWVLVRNIMNILFIVTLIVIGLATLFRVDKYTYRNLLVRLIINALLINFSLVFARLILGVADTVQAQFLPQAAEVINKLTYNLLVLPNSNQIIGWFSGTFSNVIASVFYLIFAIGAFFAFLAIAAFLVIRIVALWLLLLASPFAYGLRILPATENFATKWWTEFLRYAFFTPILGFFLTVTALLTNSQSEYIKATTENTIQFAQNQTSAQFIYGVLSNILIIIFLFVGLHIARQSGVYGAKAIADQAEKWTKTVGGALTVKPLSAAYTSIKRNAQEFKQEATRRLAMQGSEHYLGGVEEEKEAKGDIAASKAKLKELGGLAFLTDSQEREKKEAQEKLLAARGALKGAVKSQRKGRLQTWAFRAANPITAWKGRQTRVEAEREKIAKFTEMGALESSEINALKSLYVDSEAMKEAQEHEEEAVSHKYATKTEAEDQRIWKDMMTNPQFKTVKGKREIRGFLRAKFSIGAIRKLMRHEIDPATGQTYKYDIGTSMDFLQRHLGDDPELDRFLDSINDEAKKKHDPIWIAAHKIDREKFVPAANELRNIEFRLSGAADGTMPPAAEMSTLLARKAVLEDEIYGVKDAQTGLRMHGGILEEWIIRNEGQMEKMSGADVANVYGRALMARMDNPATREWLKKGSRNLQADFKTHIIEKVIGTQYDPQGGEFVFREEGDAIFNAQASKLPEREGGALILELTNRALGIRDPKDVNRLVRLDPQLRRRSLVQKGNDLYRITLNDEGVIESNVKLGDAERDVIKARLKIVGQRSAATADVFDKNTRIAVEHEREGDEASEEPREPTSMT